MSDDAEATNPRRGALIALAVAVVLGIGTWFGLSFAADKGLDRLARIDRLRAGCDSAWSSSRTRADSLRVNTRALSDTIDPRSNAALKVCGSLRLNTEAKRLPNPREMSGEPMPRGLR